MYLDHIKNKLGSTNARVHTGKSETVKRLHRKKGGCIKRTKHNMGDVIEDDGSLSGLERKNFYKKALAEHHHSPFAMGGDISPAPAAAKYGHKKGKRVKREHHMKGEILAAASAIPAIIDLIKRRKH